MVNNPPAKRAQFNSWVRKIPWRRDRLPTPVFLGFPCGSVGNESVCNMRDLGLIPGSGRSPGGGYGNPLQYSCLENPMGRGAWQEYWSGLPCPSLGDRANPGIKPRSPALQVDSSPPEPPGKPKNTRVYSLSLLQGIFLTKESNQGLLSCRLILYHLSYQGSPSFKSISRTIESKTKLLSFLEGLRIISGKV